VLSHFLVIASQSEKQTLAHFNKAMPEYEKRIQAQDGVKTMRIAKNGTIMNTHQHKPSDSI
jgi:hypothetical protein